jgi:acetyltransferase-like isoleucine patch superfamily enzyme
MASRVGKHTYGHDAIRIVAPTEAKLYIGSFCSIAQGVTVFLGADHRTDWITTFPFGNHLRDAFPSFDGNGHPRTRGDVRVGNDVWIASGATIMSGVTVGDGAVIGANAHVVRDVPPYCVVGGNPAKVIRKRFSDEQISSLLDIAWWSWPDSKINEASPILCSSGVEEFIEKYKNS